MTGLLEFLRRQLVVVICVFAAIATALTALMLGGPWLARWAIAACVLVAVQVAVAAVPRPEFEYVPNYASGRTPERHGYPSHEELSRMVDWSMNERRYCDRVLVPWLAQLALDQRRGGASSNRQSARTWLRERIDDVSWRLVDIDATPASGSSDDPPPPTDADLAALIDQLEHLEQR